jgi:hypothetical protein
LRFLEPFTPSIVPQEKWSFSKAICHETICRMVSGGAFAGGADGKTIATGVGEGVGVGEGLGVAGETITSDFFF